jgi:predicted acyl esterase
MNAHGADDDPNENQYYSDYLSYWMDYWLADDPNGIIDSAKYVYASSSYPRSSIWTWTHFNSTTWPPAGVQNINFYLTPNYKLRTVVNNLLPDTIGFLNDIKDQSLTMTEAVNREFTGSIFNSKFGKTSIVFETPALIQDTKLVGTPMVNVHYKCDGNKSHFAFQVWDVSPNNTANLVTRADAMERNITPNVIRQLTYYGASYSHIFKAGDKIRVILTNLDNIPNDPFLRTNPFVLPSLVRARNVIYMNSANPTYIQLPLIGYIPNNVISNTSIIPKEYHLEQNYPNPFNPVTKIKFGIPVSKSPVHVRFIIYDITGRRIAKLIDDTLSPGEHEVMWNASDVPSGIYFYKIETDNFVDSKKMMLIK